MTRMCRFRTSKAGASTSLSRWGHLSWPVVCLTCPLQCMLKTRYSRAVGDKKRCLLLELVDARTHTGGKGY